VIRAQDGKALYGLAMIEDITERKRAEEALRESEQRYRAIFEQAADSLWLVDAETGALVVFNDRAHENLGYTREEFERLKIPDFEVIECAEEVAKHIEKVVKEGADTFETKHRTKGGEIRDILVSSRAITVGGKDFVQSICRDITERKRAEEALRESEEKLRNLFESVSDGIFALDLSGVYTDVNQRMLEMHGFSSRDDLLGQSGLDLVSPHDLERVMADMQKTLQEGSIADHQYSAVRADGSEFPVEVSGAVLEDGSGNPVGFIGISRDITERKRADEALRESHESYKELANSIADVFFAMDKDLRYTYWNKASEDLTGIPAKDAIGKSLYDLFPDTPQTRRAETVYLDVLRRQQPRTFVNEYQLEGKGFVFEISAYPSRDGLSVFVKDITERKRAEDEISHRSKQLALINEVGQRIAPILELNELYQTVVEAVQEKFGYQNVAILSVRGDEVALEAIGGPEAKLAPLEGYTQKIGEGMVGWVAQSGETLLANDVTKEPRFLHLDYLDIAAELDVPIRLGGKTIGVLLVDSDRPNVFTEADVTTLETIAGQVARAIENARLYGERRRKAEELATLNAIAMTVTSTLDLQEILHAIQERVMESLGEIYPPLFFLFNEEDQTLKVVPTRMQEQGLRSERTGDQVYCGLAPLGEGEVGRNRSPSFSEGKDAGRGDRALVSHCQPGGHSHRERATL